MLFKRSSGNWTQLGNAYSSGPLAAGTQLKLMVVGSTLSFLENGVERIAVYDNGLVGGAPGIIAYGTGKVDNWSGGSAGFEVHYLSTDANGVESYDMISADDGYGPQILRVLRPTNPAAGVAHNFLFVLPVEPGLGTSYGDGLATVEAANAQNQYNLTIIEPSFAIDPWYANNPNDPNLQYETFMTSELEPWVKANLATTGTEQNWLIGFSKSGIGAEDLLLKHPICSHSPRRGTSRPTCPSYDAVRRRRSAGPQLRHRSRTSRRTTAFRLLFSMLTRRRLSAPTESG